MVIANGTEGEPASAKDRVVLGRSPHLVLDGAAIAAELTGARQALIVTPHPVRDIVTDAVAVRAAAGPEPVRWRVITAAEGFVAGQASAVVHWIDRVVPTPTATPPRLAAPGLRGAPTLVHNVETLAHLALIARYGADWFRSAGGPSRPLRALLLGGYSGTWADAADAGPGPFPRRAWPALAPGPARA